MKHRYLVAFGSNMRHGRIGSPECMVAAAMASLEQSPGIKRVTASRILRTAPIGPSRRRFANAAAVVKAKLGPEELLDELQALERLFGRRSRSPRWSARVLDCDIILWSGGCWESEGLIIPHPAFRMRDFVLQPALAVAAGWRDPVTGLTLRQLRARLTRPVPARNAPLNSRTRAWGP